MEIQETNSGGSAKSKLIRKRFLGEITEKLNERTLEVASSFCHADFALELIQDHLYLYSVWGGDER